MNMYAPQASIDPSLAALLKTAQMVTPDQTPTVAAQVAQAAQQKMQPQGIMQGMQGAKMDRAAAQPSMDRNMQQQQVQQMMRQAMQPQPAGIEGIPAQNMQGMQRMAEGGVVGFAGDGEYGSYVPNAEAIALDELRVAEAKRRREEEEQRRKQEFLVSAGAPQAMQPSAPRPQVTPAAPPMSPEARAMTQQQGPRGQVPAPAPRPEARPAAERDPAAGIAQLVAPTMDRSRVDSAGKDFATEAAGQEAALRKIAADKEAAIKGMPDLNEQGIASLKRAEQERRRLLGIDQSDDSRRRWAGIFRGWGGDRDAYDRILTGIASRDAAANQAQLASEQAELKLREAQQAKALGQFDRAKALEQEVAELKNKARDDMLKARQIESSLAASEFTGKANIYNTDVSARERAADRAQQALLEGRKLAQQAELNGQTKLANQINAANITVSSAIEKMNRDLEKTFGVNKKLYDMMKPEDMEKNPQIVAAYKNYLSKSDEIYRTSVAPAIKERDRLAAMVTSGQDLSKWGEPQVRTGR